LSFYLDTNAIYSYVFEDAHSQRIDDWIASRRAPIVVSDWAEAEFYALVGRRTRSGGLTPEAVDVGIRDFVTLAYEHAQRLSLSAAAGALAANLARDPKLKLSAADALHLALSAHGDHCLVTFDERLAEAARARGFAVEIP
jgi:predicted nucleic acid-binding protein